MNLFMKSRIEHKIDIVLEVKLARQSRPQFISELVRWLSSIFFSFFEHSLIQICGGSKKLMSWLIFNNSISNYYCIRFLTTCRWRLYVTIWIDYHCTWPNICKLSIQSDSKQILSFVRCSHHFIYYFTMVFIIENSKNLN